MPEFISLNALDKKLFNIEWALSCKVSQLRASDGTQEI